MDDTTIKDASPGADKGSDRVEDAGPGSRRRARTWRSFAKNKAAVVGLAILALFVFAAIFAPFLTPYDPFEQDLALSLQPPSMSHLLGTDGAGRDILARIMFGGRYTLVIGLLAVALAVIIGVPLGLISGYFGGWVDMVIQRVTDIMLSFNTFLLALALVAVLGVGMKSVIIAVGIGVVPQFIRLTRGVALSLKQGVYIEAAESFGASRLAILRRHLLRNAVTPIVVFATLNIGVAILVASGLGFLGLGVQPPAAEWGTMLADGRQYIFSAAYVSAFPGLAVFLVVLGFNLAGDGLRDALDPNLRTE